MLLTLLLTMGTCEQFECSVSDSFRCSAPFVLTDSTLACGITILPMTALFSLNIERTTWCLLVLTRLDVLVTLISLCSLVLEANGLLANLWFGATRPFSMTSIRGTGLSIAASVESGLDACSVRVLVRRCFRAWVVILSSMNDIRATGVTAYNRCRYRDLMRLNIIMLMRVTVVTLR